MNKFTLLPFPLLVLLIALNMVAGAAHGDVKPLQIADRGVGGYLIYPLYVVNQGHDTLIEVRSNIVPDPQMPGQTALRLRVMDADGAVSVNANLYLPPNGTWVAALTRIGGEPHLVMPPDAGQCLLVETGGAITPVESLPLGDDHGWVEIAEMGLLGSSQALQNAINNARCDDLAQAWNSGTWAANFNNDMLPPRGVISGSSSIINVGRGTFYESQALALRNFSNVRQHLRPGNPQPNLSTAQAPGPFGLTTVSRVCVDGNCFEDVWDDPIDAVAAVLFSAQLKGQFSTDPGLNAATEWVVLDPTRPFYPNLRWGNPQTHLRIWDRAGRAAEDTRPCPLECPEYTALQSDRPLVVIDFNQSIDDVGQVRPSTILGIMHPVRFPVVEAPVPANGQAQFRLDRTSADLVNPSGRRYFGRPAIGVGFTEFTNQLLTSPDGVQQRANYGRGSNLRRAIRITGDPSPL